VHDRKHPFQIDKGIVRAVAAKSLPEHLAYRRKDGFPMHGHLNVRCERGLFEDGYMLELTSLTADGLDHLMATAPQYYLAKLASIEVFGRLFDRDETPDSVTEHLARHARVEV
jgi:asparagine synthase (glutamine-hydrolysing)